jgi:ApaG protein
MVSQITKGIKISVLTSFEGTYFKNYKIHFAFTTRHWEIYDALNNIEVVDGEGVIGEKPVIKPGESYTYSSGCLLSSPIGAMKGYFNMVNFTSTRSFRVIIPTFKLSAPFAIN